MTTQNTEPLPASISTLLDELCQRHGDRPALMSIDRDSVSFAVVAARARQHDFMAPRDAVEAILAQAWGDVLGIDGIGTDDNFFALGCDSLKASRAVARIELAATEIFRHPTVAGLAAQVRRKFGPDVIAELESILDDASRHRDAGRTSR